MGDTDGDAVGVGRPSSGVSGTFHCGPRRKNAESGSGDSLVNAASAGEADDGQDDADSNGIESCSGDGACREDRRDSGL